MIAMKKEIYGVIHLAPLPGTPFYHFNSFENILEKAIKSALTLQKGGATGALIQTVDRVYSESDLCDPARVSSLAIISDQIRKQSRADFRVGLEVMPADILTSLGISLISKLDFIRSSNFVSSFNKSMSELSQINAYNAIKYRKQIGAESIHIIADIYSRHNIHNHPITSMAEIALRCGANAVSFTSGSDQRNVQWCDELKKHIPKAKVYLSGNTTYKNVANLLQHFDGAFVGRDFEDQKWGGQPELNCVERYINSITK